MFRTLKRPQSLRLSLYIKAQRCGQVVRVRGASPTSFTPEILVPLDLDSELPQDNSHVIQNKLRNGNED